jgi:hypothetical protein
MRHADELAAPDTPPDAPIERLWTAARPVDAQLGLIKA